MEDKILKSLTGWRKYKKYLIGEWIKSKDVHYRKSIRKVDKIIKKLLRGQNEGKY